MHRRRNFTSTYRGFNVRLAQCLNNSVLNVPSRGLLRDYESSDGPSFQALSTIRHPRARHSAHVRRETDLGSDAFCTAPLILTNLNLQQDYTSLKIGWINSYDASLELLD